MSMTHFKILAILFSFLTFPMTHSKQDIQGNNDCSFVDLRTLGKLTTVNREQGDIGWCYAFAAADLVQFYYNTVPLSAANIAINYNDLGIANVVHWFSKIRYGLKPQGRNVNYLEPETGLIELALKNSFKVGFCSRENMPDEKVVKVNLATQEKEMVDLEVAMYDMLRDLRNTVRKNPSQLKHMYEFPHVGTQEIAEILLKNKKQKIFNVINNRSCQDNEIHLPLPKIVQKIKSPHILKYVDQQLDKANIVSLDYTSNVLRDKKKANKIFQSLHTSTIVGRRWSNENNQCEYLIRNSAGSSCDNKYDPSYECDDGNIWIGKKYLHKSMLRVTYLQ